MSDGPWNKRMDNYTVDMHGKMVAVPEVAELRSQIDELTTVKLHLEADKNRQNKKINEQQKRIDELQVYRDSYFNAEKVNSELEARIAKLRTALEFYADKLNWRKQSQSSFTITNKKDVHINGNYRVGGKKALEALTEDGEE